MSDIDLGPRDAALIIRASGEIEMRLPTVADYEPAPDAALWVGAIGARFANDEAWRAEMAEWFRKQATTEH